MPKINGLRAVPVIVPMRRKIKTASGSIPAAPLVLIDITTDVGVIGRSYVFAYSPIMLQPIVTLLAELEPLLQGQEADAEKVATLFERQFRLLGRQGALAMALAGIDMALWDFAGKRAEQSVCALLGATPKPVACYDSYGLVDPTLDGPAIEKTLKQGFNAIKIKIGDRGLAQDVETLKWLRDVVGSDVQLMVDYNQSLSASEAVERVHAIEQEVALAWVEEPVLAEDFAGHAVVRSKIKSPLQTGENWWGPEDAARAVQAGICDHAMPDLMKIGGVTGWCKAADILSDASIPISSHLFVEASAHVMPATPNPYLLEYMDVASKVLAKPYKIADGTLTAQGPGLGLEWDEAAVEQYTL